MDRKEFIKKAGALFISIPVITTLSCSSDDSDPAPSGGNNQGNCTNGTNSAISSNHGHSLTVSTADVQSGVERTYTIQGTSGHNHDVTITAANFTTLSSGQTIQVTSTSGNGHTHAVTVSCA